MKKNTKPSLTIKISDRFVMQRARNVMDIVVVNGHEEPISNPRRYSLRFA